jgi:hypothetical protein
MRRPIMVVVVGAVTATAWPGAARRPWFESGTRDGEHTPLLR